MSLSQIRRRILGGIMSGCLVSWGPKQETLFVGSAFGLQANSRGEPGKPEAPNPSQQEKPRLQIPAAANKESQVTKRQRPM